MKKLLIIRHAKAAEEGTDGDFSRPLKKSGEEDAHDLAKKLKKKAILPEIIYTSPALRAKTTASIVAEHNNIPLGEPIQAIYEASDRDLFSIINSFPNQYDFVGLTGHNPGLSMVSTYLSSAYHSLPTCGAVLIEFDLDDWAMVSAATGKVTWVYEP